jgi:hypothetical protein
VESAGFRCPHCGGRLDQEQAARSGQLRLACTHGHASSADELLAIFAGALERDEEYVWAGTRQILTEYIALAQRLARVASQRGDADTAAELMQRARGRGAPLASPPRSDYLTGHARAPAPPLHEVRMHMKAGMLTVDDECLNITCDNPAHLVWLKPVANSASLSPGAPPGRRLRVASHVLRGLSHSPARRRRGRVWRDYYNATLACLGMALGHGCAHRRQNRLPGVSPSGHEGADGYRLRPMPRQHVAPRASGQTMTAEAPTSEVVSRVACVLLGAATGFSMGW